jgi:hypothetical protein
VKTIVLFQYKNKLVRVIQTEFQIMEGRELKAAYSRILKWLE